MELEVSAGPFPHEALGPRLNLDRFVGREVEQLVRQAMRAAGADALHTNAVLISEAGVTLRLLNPDGTPDEPWIERHLTLPELRDARLPGQERGVV